MGRPWYFLSLGCRLDLVALPEELPLVECLQLKQKLEAILPFHFGYLHINQLTPDFAIPTTDEGLSAEVAADLEHNRRRGSARYMLYELLHLWVVSEDREHQTRELVKPLSFAACLEAAGSKKEMQLQVDEL